MIENDATRIAREAYEAAADAERIAAATRKAAYTLWMTAREAQAQQDSHPLAGKTVQMTERASRNNGSFYRPVWEKYDRTVTGIVTLATVNNNRRRNHQPTPGEWFVLSKSGATGYRLTDDWKEA